MIKFRCHHCDKKIGVPENYATKMIKCPQCANPTIVPGVIYEEPATEQIPLADESAPASEDQSRQDGFPALTPQVEQDDLTDQDTPWTDEMFETTPDAEPEAAEQERNCSQCGTEVPEDSEFCVSCGRKVPLPETAEVDDQPSKKGIIGSIPAGQSFGIDVLRLMSPVRSLDDGIAFFFLVILQVLANINIFGPVLAGGYMIYMARLMVLGIIYTFLFNVLLTTANGEDELPKFEMPTSSWVLVRPYFQMTVSYLYVILPFIVCFIAGLFWVVGSAVKSMENTGLLDEPTGQEYFNDMEEPVPENEIYQEDSEVSYEEPDDSFFEEEEYTKNDNFMGEQFEDIKKAAYGFYIFMLVVLFVGLLFWPMIVLTIVLGDRFIISPIKIISNIFRTFKPYLICCVAMYLTVFMFYLTNVTFAIEGLSGNSFAPFLGAITAIVGGLCIQIYNMRLLGLLYRYYGEKLDW